MALSVIEMLEISIAMQSKSDSHVSFLLPCRREPALGHLFERTIDDLHLLGVRNHLHQHRRLLFRYVLSFVPSFVIRIGLQIDIKRKYLDPTQTSNISSEPGLKIRSDSPYICSLDFAGDVGCLTL